MFDIYIRNFNQNGTIVTQETLMQTIPASSENALKLVSPIVKCEMGSAEGLDFSIETGTQFYDAFLQMKTYIRIVYDGDTIFYGRVLTIDNNGLRGTRRIRCEGPYSFLLDSPVQGIQEKNRAETTIQNYMSQLINNHNTYLENDPNKKFLLGEVPGQYSAAVSAAQQIKNDKKRYGSDSWTDTKGALEDLRSHYGGYFRTRTTSEGTYLDWMDHYFNASVNAQTVEVGKNILDINDVTEIDNIFTAIIPIGKNNKATSKNSEDTGLYIDGYRTDVHGSGKLLHVADIAKVYSDEELNTGYHKAENYKNAYNNYGMIIKTVTFNDATTKEKLFNDACEWIKNNYQGEVTKFTVKAIDMHQIGQDTTKIMVGDQVNIVYPIGKEDGSVEKRTVKLTCLNISYDLYRPENNSYTFGIPANVLTKTYGLHKSTQSINTVSTKPPPPPSGTDVGEEVPWIDLVRGWLQRHKVHYNGSKPYKDEYGSAYQPETDPYMYLSPADSGDLRTYLVHGHRHMTGADKDGHIIDIGEDEKVTPEMKYQGGIYWTPTMDSVDYVNEAAIYKYNVIEWVQYEYGYDLRTMLAVKAPAMTVDEDGNVTITKEVYNPDLEEVQAIRRMYYDNASSTIEIYDQDGDNQVIKAYLDENNNWTYWYEDKDGNIQPTSVRDLSIMEIDNKNKIGWVVQENGQGDLEFANPGEMTMAIEKFANGEMVVTRISGEQTYIGNTKTQRLTSVSLEHMDSVTGDFEYVPDDVDPHLQVIRLNSGAGMRNYHAVKKLKKPLPDPEHPDNPENWEYSYIDDPQHPGQKILEMGEYGVYDKNTLVGGIVSQILNDGSVHTKIKGNVVDIESGTVRIGDFSDILSFPTRADFPAVGDPTKTYIAKDTNIPYEWADTPGTGVSGYFVIDHTLHTLNYTQDGINTTLSLNVGDLYSISGDLQQITSDMDRRVYTIEGSAIWKDRDHIVNVAGEYEIIEAPDGTRTLRIKSGGGLRIQKDGVDFGVYMTDANTGDTVLTGGIVTEKINDQGDTYTKIAGKYLDIEASTVRIGNFSDIKGYETRGDFPGMGKVDITYIAKDTNTPYKWDPTSNTYVEIPHTLRTLNYYQDGINVNGTLRIGNLESTSGELVRTTNEHGTWIHTFEGTSIWKDQDHIVNVAGEYDVITNPDGTKTLRIKSGGGLRIQKDNVDFGVYMTDANTGDTVLTGGIVTEKLNNQGDTATKIKGTYVDIEASTVRIGNFEDDIKGYASRNNFPATGNTAYTYIAKNTNTPYKWNSETSSYVETEHTFRTYNYYNNGLVAEKATIGELNAAKARITTLETDSLKTKDLYSEISALDKLVSKRVLVTANVGYGASVPEGAIVADDFLFKNGLTDHHSLKNAIKELQIVQNGNTYTLQKKDYDDTDWENVGSFSRAVTGFTGSWSGGVYSMTPIPQGSPTYKIGLSSSCNLWLDVVLQKDLFPTKYESNPKYLQVPIEVVQRPDQYHDAIRTDAKQTKIYDATPVWNDGQANGRNSVTASDPSIYATSTSPSSAYDVPTGTSVKSKTSTGKESSASGITYYESTFDRYQDGKKDVPCIKAKLSSGTVVGLYDLSTFYTTAYSDGQANGRNSVTASDPSIYATSTSPSSAYDVPTGTSVKSKTSTGKESSASGITYYESTFDRYQDGKKDVPCIKAKLSSGTVVGLYDLSTFYTTAYSDGQANGRNSVTASDPSIYATSTSPSSAYDVPTGTSVKSKTSTGKESSASGITYYESTFDRYQDGKKDVPCIKAKLSSGTVVGLYDLSTFYTTAYSDGQANGRNSVTASDPSIERTTASDNYASTISVKSKTSTGKTSSASTITFSLGTFNQYGVSDNPHQCLDALSNGVNVGRYDLQTYYNNTYTSGWRGAYGTVGLDSTTAIRLGYNEAVTVKAQAKETSGASSKTDVASRTLYGPFGEIKSFDTTSPSGESYTAGTTTYTNNDDGYYLSGSGDSASAVIVVKSTFNLDSTANPRTGKSYLLGTPTRLYKKGYSDGAGSVSRNVTFFDTSAPEGATIGIYTNNSDGYYLSGSGSSANAAIVVNGEIRVAGGSSQNKTSYLSGAPTRLYKKGYSDGASSVARKITFPSSASTGTFGGDPSVSLSGWNPVPLSGGSISGSTPNVYRYIKFYVDGVKRSIYFP